MNARLRPSRRARRGAAVLWLACALITVSQWVGLMHGYVHPHGGLHDVVAAEAQGEPWAGHDEGSAECRLLDQLAHAEGLLMAGAALAPPAAAGTLQAAARQQPRAGACCAGFWARGPPSIVA